VKISFLVIVQRVATNGEYTLRKPLKAIYFVGSWWDGSMGITLSDFEQSHWWN